MAKAVNGYRQTEDDLAGTTFEDSRRIVRLSQMGFTTTQIADSWQIAPEDVVRTMAQAGYEEGLSPMVKRLTKDPEDLCCSISAALFEDPVVAEDGNTYELQHIKDWLAEKTRNRQPPTSPLTGKPLKPPVQLNPNQNMAFRVIAFKEETVAEIMTIAPFLLKIEAIEALKDLLERAETFVRPLLDKDASASSARKQLFKLLVLRMRMPEMKDEARRSVCSLLEQMSDGQIQGILYGIEESQLCALLSELNYETIERLRTSISPGVCRNAIDRELVCRLVIGLDDDFDDDSWFKKLWQLLLQNAKHVGSEQQEWKKAAAVVLASGVERVGTSLKDLDDVVLHHACEFLDSKEQTLDFAKSFFKYDRWIRADQHVWPPSSSASILMELESRSTGAEQKLGLLVKAHKISPSDAIVRQALLWELHRKILSDCPSTSQGRAFDLEDLFVELVVEEKGEIPADVIHKLSLKDVHLRYFKGDLKLLAEQLCQANRRADGARAAVMLAQKLARDGEKERAEDTFLFAFRLDPTNIAAAGGLLDLAKQVIATSQATPAKTPAAATAAATAATPAAQQEVSRQHAQTQERAPSSARTRDPNIPSLASLRLSESLRCFLESDSTSPPATPHAATARADPQDASACETLLLDWDLTGKDFTNCRNEDGESSPKFQISKDVKASITVYPAAAKPSCTLNLNRPAEVKLRVQAGNSTRIVESVNGMKYKWFDLSSHLDLQGHLTVHALSAC